MESRTNLHWKAAAMPANEAIQSLQTALGVPSVMATLLVQRGILDFDSAKAFFRPQWEDLHDPFLMKDMRAAVERIDRARAAKSTLMIYGDYDVDGTTSVALMTAFLSPFFPRIIPYIPDRYMEGYGVSIKGIDHAVSAGVDLIITLDCGIKAKQQIAYAASKGIDVIVCDHHLPGEELPSATAVLDPKRTDCSYPFKELCGCGIGFKLAQALTQHWQCEEASLFPLLDLVATAIAADIVPLEGENRVLTFLGLQHLQKNPRKGIALLLGTLKKPVAVSDLVFKVAPRINAAGRMQHALTAVGLLLEENHEKAAEVAARIEAYNQERRATDERITQEALEQIESNGQQEKAATVVHATDWHKGVVGIVASRLIEHYYRPTVVLTQSGDRYVGSVRSVRGYDVYQALLACREHMLQFGGHKYAAGLTLAPDQLEDFIAAFEAEVDATILPEQKVPQPRYDLAIDLAEIQPKLVRILLQMAPFGPKNMRPVFCSRGCVDSGGSRLVGKDQSHLRLSIGRTGLSPLIGIAFGQANAFERVQKGHPFTLFYTLEQNEWNGEVSTQLQVKDILFEE